MLNFFQKIKIFVFLLLLSSLTLLCHQTIAETPSCTEILRKVDLAIDPYNKGDSIKTFKILSTSKISKFGEFELDYQMIFKSPDKFKTSLQFLTLNIMVIFNGKEGYILSPIFGNEKLPEKEIKSTLQQIQFMNVATKYSKLFQNSELSQELVEINNRKCYKIQGVLPNYFSNIPLTLYIDCETYYILRYTMEIAAQNKQGIITVNHSDYTEYDGIFLPRVSSSQVGRTNAINTIKSVKFNIDIDDKIFNFSNY